jgi:hypothetical protein
MSNMMDAIKIDLLCREIRSLFQQITFSLAMWRIPWTGSSHPSPSGGVKMGDHKN